MSEFDRRTFLKRMGKGAAVLGITGAATGAVWPKTGVAKAAVKDGAGRKYQTFQPGQYFDWEKKYIEKNIKTAANPPKMGGGETSTDVQEWEILSYNHTWDPYNPLFNDKQYARKAGYPNVPALPCFKTPNPGAMSMAIPAEVADLWYFAHGPDVVEFYDPIYGGDSLSSDLESLFFDDITAPGSDLRKFRFGGAGNMYNQKGELVVRNNGTLTNGYKKIIDGSPAPSYTEQMSKMVDHLPEAHYTTDEEWEYIKELWRKEEIRGSQKLYWEDVNIGDEPSWTCSGPVTYMDMVYWYGGVISRVRDRVLAGKTDELFRDRFGNYLLGQSNMYGGRNIVGARSVFYNDTGAKFVTRMLTNWIGDAGFVTGLSWIFQQSMKAMQLDRPGGELLDKVPYMKGKGCTVHGSEGDCAISKGYVTDKRINEKGEHIVDLTCWCETLDDRIVEVCGASVRLPSKKG